MKNEIRERFADAVAYDELMVKVFPGYQQLPLVILSHLRTFLGSRARVLDVGCGTGTTMVSLAKHQSGWTMTGIDPAASMLELAREKANKAELSDRLAFVNGTIDELPDEVAFDAAISVLVEHLQPDDGAKLRLFQGVSRRLSSGGCYITVGLHGDLSGAIAQRHLESWIQFVALQGLPEPVQAGVRHKASVEDSLVPEARIKALLEEAGFTHIERIYQVQLLGGWIAQKR